MAKQDTIKYLNEKKADNGDASDYARTPLGVDSENIDRPDGTTGEETFEKLEKGIGVGKSLKYENSYLSLLDGEGNELSKQEVGGGGKMSYLSVSNSNSNSVTNAVAWNFDSIALGYGSNASGVNSIAIGSYSNTNSFGSTALGCNSYASDVNSVAIGSYSNANSVGSTVLGSYSNANGNSSIAIGHLSKVNNSFSIALGYGSSANGVNSIALGTYSNTEGFSIAIGRGSTVIGLNCIAIGSNVTANYSGSVTIGYRSNTSGFDSIAIGSNTTANYDTSIALGSRINAHGSNSIALGHYCECTNNSIVIGNDSKARGSDYSIAIGVCTNADEIYSTALGFGARATGKGSIALGSYSVIYGSNSTAIGYASKATSNYSIAIGGGSNAEGFGSTALGCNSYAGGNHSVAIGSSSNAYGYNSIAIGHNSYVGNSYSVAIGVFATTTNANSIQLGDANNLSSITAKVPITTTSDERDKTDITELDNNALEFLNKIKTIRYVFNGRKLYIDKNNLTDKEKEKLNTYGMCTYDKKAHEQGTKKGSRFRVGVSAQNIQQALVDIFGDSGYANLVNDNLFDYNPDEIPDGVESQLAVNYEGFIPFLIKAIQELDAKVKRLESEE